MSFGDSDLGVFTADMGVSATFGASTVKGIFDESDEIESVADSTVQATVTGITLTVKASDWPTVTDESAVTIGARSFVVRGSARLLADGKFKVLDLAEVT